MSIQFVSFVFAKQTIISIFTVCFQPQGVPIVIVNITDKCSSWPTTMTIVIDMNVRPNKIISVVSITLG